MTIWWFMRGRSAALALSLASAFVAGAGFLGATAAWAQDGTYIEGAFGLSLLSPTDGYYQLAPDHPVSAYQNRRMPTVTNYDPGFDGAIRVGRIWNSFRADFEAAYSRNTVRNADYLGTDGVTDTWANDPGATGHLDALSLMGNIYVDFDKGSAIIPYLGVGAGAGYVGGSFHGTSGTYLDSHIWVPAAQLIAGASIPLNAGWSIVLDYRLKGFFDVNMRQDFASPIPNAVCTAGPTTGQCGSVAVGTTGNVFDNVLSIGLRANLN